MPHRQATAAALSAVLGAVVLLGAPAAHAGDVYRTWAAFEVDGDRFVAVEDSLGNLRPEDGTLLGLRYAAPADFDRPNLPRADLAAVTFDAVCATTAPPDDGKRVAVVIDFGVPADAPEGSGVPAPVAGCARLPASATSLDAVDAVASPRIREWDFGPILCAVDDYPAEGCSAIVDRATPEDEGTIAFPLPEADGGADLGSGPLPWILGVGAAVLLLAAAGAVAAWRGRSA